MDEEPKDIIEEPFIGKDLLESYIYFKSKISLNNIEMYRILQQRIIFGKNLLWSLRTSINKDKIDAMIAIANKALKKKPGLRKIIVDQYHLKQTNGETRLIHRISSDDMNEIQVLDEKYVENLDAYIKQQYEQCLDTLHDIFSEIDNYLTECEMFKVSNPTDEELLNEIIKKALSEELEQMTEKIKGEEDVVQ